MLQQHGIDIKNLDAIGVTCGPGSYTGIRVGLATAKGLCYALKIPLITCNSLETMAVSAMDLVKDNNAFYCPMIDARRMEVYAAVYNYRAKEIIPPSAIILNENSFTKFLDSHKIFFSGSGSYKFKQLSNHVNSVFLSQDISPVALASMCRQKYLANEFENVTYAQPLYIK